MHAALSSVETIINATCLRQAFDDLLLLKRGGHAIYVGHLGVHSVDLVRYFEASTPLPLYPLLNVHFRVLLCMYPLLVKSCGITLVSFRPEGCFPAVLQSNLPQTKSLCSACCPIAAKGADVRKPCALDQAVQGVPPLTKGINPATWMLEVSTLAKEAQLRVNFADIYRNSSLYRWAPAPTKISKHFFIVFLWSPSCNAGHGGRGPTAHCFSVVRFSVAQYWNAALLYTLSWRLQSLSAASFENDTHRCMCIPNVMVTQCVFYPLSSLPLIFHLCHIIPNQVTAGWNCCHHGTACFNLG